jgi:hypothetical protein
MPSSSFAIRSAAFSNLVRAACLMRFAAPPWYRQTVHTLIAAFLHGSPVRDCVQCTVFRTWGCAANLSHRFSEDGPLRWMHAPPGGAGDGRRCGHGVGDPGCARGRIHRAEFRPSEGGRRRSVSQVGQFTDPERAILPDRRHLHRKRPAVPRAAQRGMRRRLVDHACGRRRRAGWGADERAGHRGGLALPAWIERRRFTDV